MIHREKRVLKHYFRKIKYYGIVGWNNKCILSSLQGTVRGEWVQAFIRTTVFELHFAVFTACICNGSIRGGGGVANVVECGTQIPPGIRYRFRENYVCCCLGIFVLYYTCFYSIFSAVRVEAC